MQEMPRYEPRKTETESEKRQSPGSGQPGPSSAGEPPPYRSIGDDLMERIGRSGSAPNSKLQRRDSSWEEEFEETPDTTEQAGPSVSQSDPNFYGPEPGGHVPFDDDKLADRPKIEDDSWLVREAPQEADQPDTVIYDLPLAPGLIEEPREQAHSSDLREIAEPKEESERDAYHLRMLREQYRGQQVITLTADQQLVLNHTRKWGATWAGKKQQIINRRDDPRLDQVRISPRYERAIAGRVTEILKLLDQVDEALEYHHVPEWVFLEKAWGLHKELVELTSHGPLHERLQETLSQKLELDPTISTLERVSSATDLVTLLYQTARNVGYTSVRDDGISPVERFMDRAMAAAADGQRVWPPALSDGLQWFGAIVDYAAKLEEAKAQGHDSLTAFAKATSTTLAERTLGIGAGILAGYLLNLVSILGIASVAPVVGLAYTLITNAFIRRAVAPLPEQE